MDIKNAYFHLENSPRLKPYLRLLIGGKLFQMEGGFFGLSTMPFYWQKLMNTFLKKWRQRGSDSFYLFGRHFTSWPLPRKCKKGFKGSLVRFGKLRTSVEQGKVSYRASSGAGPFRFSFKPKGGFVSGASTKNEDNKERTRKAVKHSVISPRKVSSILEVVRAFLLVISSLRVFFS